MKNVCIFESELKDGTIRWFTEKSGQMVHIVGKLNINRFENKNYIVAKKGLTSNRPSIIFPNKDRDAGEMMSYPSYKEGEQWEVNSTVFYEVYSELRGKDIKCSCEQRPFTGH